MKLVSIFDRHHAMLRFVVVFVLGAAMVCGSVAMGIVAQANADKVAFGEDALYTRTVKIASGVSGSAVGVWGSSDGTRVFVLFKLDDDSVDKMPMDASKYAVTVGSTDKSGTVQAMQVVPSGSVYVFGTTGYIGVYLVAGQRFEPQLYSAYVSCKDTDGDQVGWYVTFNPAASGIVHSKLLDDKTFDPSDFYRTVIAPIEETTLRRTLYTDLSTMYSAEQTAAEYSDRLDKLGVNRTGMIPVGVAGDVIEKDEENKVYRTTFATTVPGGIDYDWQGVSLADGGSYLEAAEKATDTSDYRGILAKMASTYTGGDKGVQLSTSPGDWTMKDGKSLTDSANSISSSSYSDITNSISQLSQAVSEYYDAKTSYQTTDLLALLSFENDVDSVSDNVTSADATIYSGK